MSNKVDKLFKDKLESHSLQPSAQAWEKVEAHLGKKNRMALALKVAAAIALLGALTFVALNWDSNYEEPKQEFVKKEAEKPAPVVEDRKEEIKKEEIRNEEPKKKAVKPAAPAIQKPVEEQPVEQIAIVPEPEPVIEKTNVEEKGITLTYSLPAIKKEEPTVTVAAVDETKKTGLERVLEIAREVKNGDNPLGNLREAKNDILALEFRKDKSKKH